MQGALQRLQAGRTGVSSQKPELSSSLHSRTFRYPSSSLHLLPFLTVIVFVLRLFCPTRCMRYFLRPIHRHSPPLPCVLPTPWQRQQTPDRPYNLECLSDVRMTVWRRAGNVLRGADRVRALERVHARRRLLQCQKQSVKSAPDEATCCYPHNVLHDLLPVVPPCNVIRIGPLQ